MKIRNFLILTKQNKIRNKLNDKGDIISNGSVYHFCFYFTHLFNRYLLSTIYISIMLKTRDTGVKEIDKSLLFGKGERPECLIR